MLKIAIIICSTRPVRKSDAVAKWSYDIARQRGDAEFELLDLADFNLPLLDEPLAAIFPGKDCRPGRRDPDLFRPL